MLRQHGHLRLLAGDRRAKLGDRPLPVDELPDHNRGCGVLAHELLPGGGQLRREVRGGRVADPADPEPDREREQAASSPAIVFRLFSVTYSIASQMNRSVTSSASCLIGRRVERRRT